MPDAGRTRRLWPLIAAVAAVLLVVDQVTKAVANSHLTPGVPRHLIGSLVKLDLTHNSGAAWSTGTGMTWFFTILAIGATALILWFVPRCADRIWALALGVLLAGVDGNLLDRFFRTPGGGSGAVVDFIELPHWPIFNVADMCINVAAVLIVLQTFRGVRLDGTRAEKKAAA